MKTTLRYNTTPLLSHKLYCQRIWVKICSVKGVFSIVGIFCFSYACITIGRLLWKMEVASINRLWVFASFLIVTLGVLPILCMAILFLIFTVRYCQARHIEAKASSIQMAVIIDDDGLTFMPGTDEKHITWEEVENLEFLKDFLVFSYRKNIIFLPRKEISDYVQAFIKSKTVQGIHKTSLWPNSGTGVIWSGRYGAKLVLYAILLVLTIGIVLMLACLLGWMFFL